MILSLLATVAVLSAPNPTASMRFEYPTAALSAGRSAAAVIDVVFDPAGKAIHCEAIQSIGDPELVATMCRVVRNGRVKPATLADGTRVHGRYRGMLRYFVPGSPMGDRIAALADAPDLTLTVDRIPEGAAREGKLVLAVDAAGVVTDCRVLPGSAGSGPLPVAICRSRSALAQPVVSDAAGRPVAYATTLRIRLAGPAPH